MSVRLSPAVVLLVASVVPMTAAMADAVPADTDNPMGRVAFPIEPADVDRESRCTESDGNRGVDARRWRARMDRYGVPGASVALIEQGELVWICALGLADVESGRALTRDAIFRVESISKPITAWGVMTLVERGMVALDEPLVRFLSSWRFPPSAMPTDRITVRQLLTHTAGLPLGDFTARFRPDAPRPTLREHLSRQAVPLVAAPAPFAYSNVGFDLLELLIEEVSGEPFSDYMRREVLAPLGMEKATFDMSAALAERLPSAYALDGEPIAPYVYPGRGSGGLLASIEDIAGFTIAGMAEPSRSTHDVLGTAAIERLQTPIVRTRGLIGLAADAYAAGHFVEMLSDGRRSLWHGGQGYGWMSHVQWVPDSGDGIVVLSNSQRAWPLFADILRDWTAWHDREPTGMAMISLVVAASWALVAVCASLAVLSLARTLSGVRAGKLTLSPGAAPARGRRLAALSLSAIIAVGLAWAATREYLFLSSLVPHVTGPLTLALAALATALLLFALFPTVPPSSPAPPGRRTRTDRRS